MWGAVFAFLGAGARAAWVLSFPDCFGHCVGVGTLGGTERTDATGHTGGHAGGHAGGHTAAHAGSGVQTAASLQSDARVCAPCVCTRAVANYND